MIPVSNWGRPNKTSRRALLKGLGSVAALAPFLPVMNASGQEGAPKRLVLWFTPHGTIHENWVPKGGTTDFEMSEILEPLAPFKDQLNILHGLEIIDRGVGFPHTKGPPLLWTASPLIEAPVFRRGGMNQGWNSAPSVDQVLLEHLKPETPYQSLEFGVRSGDNHPGSRMIYRAAERPLQPEDDPWKALANIFTGQMGGGGSAQLERLKTERLSVMDVVSQELAAVAPRLPSADRLKMESHLTAVREIETLLQTAGTSTCGAPNLGDSLNANSEQNTEKVWQTQSDLLAAALGCDLARVMSMQYRKGENDNTHYNFINISDEHHITTHSNSRSTLTRIYKWYSEQFAYFLNRLASIPEGDGSVLDNTLVVWGSELGHGRGHSFKETPFVLAGGKNLGLSTGRFLQYDDVEHNRLLVSMLELMGMPGVEQFGETERGRGVLEGLL